MKKALRNMLSDDYKWFMLAMAAGMAVCSAFAVYVFCYVRNTPDIEAYYSDGSLSLAKALFQSPRFLLYGLLILPFAGVFFLCLNSKTELSGSCFWLGLVFALNIMFALSMEHSDYTEIFLPFQGNGASILCQIFALLGFLFLCFFALHILYALMDRKCLRLAADHSGRRKLAPFLIAVSAIALCWTPVFIMCYPCSVFSDTLTQLKSYFGILPMDASHPVLTTVFYGAAYSLGLRLGGETLGVFFCALSQSVFNCLVMALICAQVRQYTKSNVWYLASILFFGVCPIWCKAAQIALKDVLHTGCFLLFYVQFLTILKEEKASLKYVLWTGLCALLVAFTRKATFWLAVVCILVAILRHRRAYAVKYGICLAAFMGLFFYCENSLYPSLGIKPARQGENYSLPLQQMALYCRMYGNELTAEDRNVINGTVDYDVIVAQYTPLISDPVKATFHGDKEATAAFFRLYLRCFAKHPLLFVKGAVMNDFEHLNPWYGANVSGKVYFAEDPSFYNVTFRSDAVWQLNHYWKSWFNIPVLRTLLSTGIFAWLLLAMTGYCARRRSLLAFLGLFPSLVLLIGLLFSHVNGEIRYGYPLIAATPLICAWVAHAVAEKQSKQEKPAEKKKAAHPKYGQQMKDLLGF